jgi:hypothetical protein
MVSQASSDGREDNWPASASPTQRQLSRLKPAAAAVDAGLGVAHSIWRR